MIEFPIYLDHAATTPVAPEVLEAMLPYFTEYYGNSATLYNLGARAKTAVDTAREQIASILNCSPDEIFFTSGGTEADNWAIRGMARNAGAMKHLLVSAIEHHAVLEPAESLMRDGFEVEQIPPSHEGVVDPEAVRSRLRPDTFLASVMHVNNEIGTIQDIGSISDVCKSAGVPFHVDAVQSFARLPIDLRSLPVSLLTMSAHKIYGPKGVGALYIRRGTPIFPWMLGGEQESGFRGGTTNVAGIVGFGAAAIRSADKSKKEQERTTLLSNILVHQVVDDASGIRLTAEHQSRVPSTVHLTIEGVEGEALLLALDMAGICASAGSACTTGSTAPSHVLLSMGMGVDQARGALRLTLGESTTEEGILFVAKTLKGIVKDLRNLA